MVLITSTSPLRLIEPPSRRPRSGYRTGIDLARNAGCPWPASTKLRYLTPAIIGLPQLHTLRWLICMWTEAPPSCNTGLSIQSFSIIGTCSRRTPFYSLLSFIQHFHMQATRDSTCIVLYTLPKQLPKAENSKIQLKRWPRKQAFKPSSFKFQSGNPWRSFPSSHNSRC